MRDSRESVLSVGAGFEQRAAIHRARAMGYRVIACDGRSDCEGRDDVDEFHLIDIADVEAVTRLARAHGILGIIPAPIGRRLTTVGAVNDALGLHGVSAATAELCADKALFHAAAVTAGLCRPRQCAGHGEYALRAAIGEVGFPCVVKPRCGSGSRGVWVLRTPDDVVPSLFRDSVADWVLERELTGPELGIDGIVVRENTTVVLVRNKRLTPRPRRVCVGNGGPAVLEEWQEMALLQTINHAVRIIGLSDGVFHADVILDPEYGATIVEISARPAGIWISEKLTPAATGCDVLETGIRLAVGEPIPRPILHQVPVWMAYGSPRVGTSFPESGGAKVLEVARPRRSGVGPLESLAGIINGGYVLATGSTLENARQLAEYALSDGPNYE